MSSFNPYSGCSVELDSFVPDAHLVELAGRINTSPMAFMLFDMKRHLLSIHSQGGRRNAMVTFVCMLLHSPKVDKTRG